MNVNKSQKASKERVLFVGPSPPPFSGPELGMKLFLESLIADRFEITFLCTNVRTSNKYKGRFGVAMIVAFFWFFSRLTRQLIVVSPRVVYYPITATQTGWVGRDAQCLLICRLFGSRTIIHLRASHFRLNFMQFSRWARWITRIALRTVERAIVQADILTNQFEDLIPSENIRTLYQAIPSREYDNPDHSHYVRGKILFMGHLTQAKGYCDLMKVIGPVVESVGNVTFYVAGTMRYGERNVMFNQVTGDRLTYEDPFVVERTITESPLVSHYSNLGLITDQEKLDHLRSCDIFVLPSYSEGFSRALVEAMCVGKPVVYTPVGAHREALVNGKNGIEVAPGDTAGLAKAIIMLLKNRPMRDEMASYNYSYVRSKFDIEIIATQLADIISECIQPASR